MFFDKDCDDTDAIRAMGKALYDELVKMNPVAKEDAKEIESPSVVQSRATQIMTIPMKCMASSFAPYLEVFNHGTQNTTSSW